ncbi:MAG TPA: hypothetical protein VFJ97_04200 [Dermatophilaceae bacterium]|nr:hypothetical protein [Dermatophilaceae bacterium]
MLSLPSPPNPLDVVGQGLGSALAELAVTAFAAAMKGLWDFSLSLLAGVLAIIDHLTVPDLDPRTGPLSSVLPSTAWVGAALLVLLCLVQLGRAALSGGGGLLHLFKGIGQYMVVTASGLGLLAALVTAADAAARGILAAGLHTGTWAGIAASNTPWQNAVHGVSGAGLGVIALLGVLPAAVGLLVAALVREASILVIAATIPILAAGLVAQATARWFWTALRWMLALVMLTPAVAVVVSIGFKVAAAASGTTNPQAADAGQQAVTAFVGAAVLLVSVFCPLALFKLFAFVDPGTPSGHGLRTSLSDLGTRGQAETTSDAAYAGGGSGATAQEAAASDGVESRWTAAVSRLTAAHRTMAAGSTAAMTAAAPILEAAGVGAGTGAALYASPGASRPNRATTRAARPGGGPESASAEPPPSGDGGSEAMAAPPDGGDGPPPQVDPPDPPQPPPPSAPPASPPPQGNGPGSGDDPGRGGSPRPPTSGRPGPGGAGGAPPATTAGVGEVAEVAVVAG